MSAIEDLRAVLDTYELRIEFSTALSIHGAHPCAILYVRGDAGRWRKADLPAIVPGEGGTRADMLRLFADVMDGET